MLLTIQKAFSILLLPVSCLWWLGQLLSHVSILRRCEVLILDAHMVNYGNVVMTADLARRMFAGRRIGYGFVWEPGSTVNVRLGKIWSDIEMFPIRRPCLVGAVLGRQVRLPMPVHLVPALNLVIRALISVVAPKAELWTRQRLYRNVPVTPELAQKLPHDYRDYGLYSQTCWIALLKRCPAPPPKLPDAERESIYKQLSEARGGREAKLCMLFNRWDFFDPDHPRNGSPIEAYVPTLRLLVERGYQVLMVGDRALKAPDMMAFEGMVVDADYLGLDLNLFRLFVPTEADICIGDSGAGTWLPMITGIPLLVLNLFPVATMPPGNWVYPKRLASPAGEEIPFIRILKEDPMGFTDPYDKKRIPSVPLVNTEEEILEAATCFLESIESSNDVQPPLELELLVPFETIFRQFDTRFSPAFLRRMEMSNADNAQQAVSQA